MAKQVQEILSQATLWMNFEDIVGSETNQSQKDIPYDFTYMKCLEQ